MKNLWQQIDSTTYRLKVPSGWIVKIEHNRNYKVFASVTFVLDIFHTWKAVTYKSPLTNT